MTVTMLKGKIHRAVVQQASLDYVGSIKVFLSMKKYRLLMWRMAAVLRPIQLPEKQEAA